MRGTQRHTIDSKNRLFVPSKYREELGAQVVVAKSLTSTCIRVYSAESWKHFEEELNSFSDLGSYYELIEWVYANSEDGEIDSQGRLALPAEYLKYASITKNIVSTGVRDHMEIWNEEIFDSKMQNTNVDELRKLLIARGM